MTDGVSLGGAASASASASASTGARVLAAIRAHVPSAYRKSETGAELHYMLPFSEARKGRFEGLFRALDADRVALGVASYGVVDTSLEEVFLKVTELADQQAAQRGQLHSGATRASTTMVCVLSRIEEFLKLPVKNCCLYSYFFY